MGTCTICARDSETVSKHLGLCLPCIRQGGPGVDARIEAVHAEVRDTFELPAAPPRAPEGVACTRCVNRCVIARGAKGSCGVRRNDDGTLWGGDADSGRASWYHDPLPTNCVADWVCAGCTGEGYPEFSRAQGGPEHGRTNLAVFYHGCSFDCLFCQNWHHRRSLLEGHDVSAESLADAVDERTACVCFFGGDPTPQMEHAVAASRVALGRRRGEGDGHGRRLLRICWETNGSANPDLMDEALALSVETGGCVKFDIKAYDETLHRALCGVTNKQTLANFGRLAENAPLERKPPPLLASTLMVPGYVEAHEVAEIAQFIASIDCSIPYSLLAFHPQFYMSDLPVTSANLARKCSLAATDAGLVRVHVGNVHLLA